MTSFLRTGGPAKTARLKALFSTTGICTHFTENKTDAEGDDNGHDHKKRKENNKDESIYQNLDEEDNDPND
eukprot:6500662-Heterocapsa_arctica.AAC.1